MRNTVPNSTQLVWTKLVEVGPEGHDRMNTSERDSRTASKGREFGFRIP